MDHAAAYRSSASTLQNPMAIDEDKVRSHSTAPCRFSVVATFFAKREREYQSIRLQNKFLFLNRHSPLLLTPLRQ